MWAPSPLWAHFLSVRGVASRQHPRLAACGAGLWVFKPSIRSQLPCHAFSSPLSSPRTHPGLTGRRATDQPGWAAHTDCWARASSVVRTELSSCSCPATLP